MAESDKYSRLIPPPPRRSLASVNCLQAVTRRAALAAFLLFAAALLVVGPAEASRTTDARSSLASIPASTLASSSSRELASLELTTLALAEPVDTSPRFGFAEDLSLLDVEARPCGFELFGGVGTKRCVLTYARNNPVTFTDPDGRLAWSSLVRTAQFLKREGKVVARIAENSKNKVMKRLIASLDRIDRSKGLKRVVIAETPESRDAIARQLSGSGKVRAPERSGIYPEHVNPADGPYEDVHIQTVADTKAAGFGKGLLSIFAPLSMTIGSSSDARPGEVASAAAWDMAKAIDPLFITDGLEYAFGLSEPAAEPPPGK